jgi:hypothetical protein
MAAMIMMTDDDVDDDETCIWIYQTPCIKGGRHVVLLVERPIDLSGGMRVQLAGEQLLLVVVVVVLVVT